MAGFKTHITTSCLLGVGYTGTGLFYLSLPLESSLIAGGLCGIGGMLPDIDSDSGVPFRESMGFAAAIVPVLMLDRFRELGLNYEQFVLVCGAMYLFVRFGIARLLSRYTVHRGMFHSLPAALIFTGVAFLVSGTTDLQLRYFKAAGVFLGVMSHLILDEIYAVEWTGGRWRFKKSFGTAMKLWGKNFWANLSTYAKLALVILMILSEPMVMQRYGQLSPVVFQSENLLGIQRDHFAQGDPTRDPREVVASPPYSTEPYRHHNQSQIVQQSMPSPEAQRQADPYAQSRDRTIYDTWGRILQSFRSAEVPHAETQR